MTYNDQLLRRVCILDETYHSAQPLLRLAQVKTAPGSGYELGPHTVGLPAICAYIASKRLKNGDVTRTSAQQASCLKAADFEKAYYLVESVLGGTRQSSNRLFTYEELITKYKIPMTSDRLVPWMKKAEKMLVEVDPSAYEHQKTMREVVGAVFLWVCSAIKGKKIMPLQNFAEETRISVKTLKRIFDTLTSSLVNFKAELLDAMKPKPRTSTAATSSPTKRTRLSSVSSNNVSQQSIPGLQSSPVKKTPSKKALRPLLMKGGSPTKRRVGFQDGDGSMTDSSPFTTPTGTDVEMETRSQAETETDMDLDQVPASSTMGSSTSSRRSSSEDELVEISSVRRASQHDDPVTPRKERLNRVRVDLGEDEDMYIGGEDAMDVDPLLTPSKATRRRKVEDQTPGQTPRHQYRRKREAPTVVLPPRRYRPIYTDFHQWNALDDQAEKMMKLRLDLKESMIQKYGNRLAERVLRESGISSQ